MSELLSISIGFGLAIGLIFTEFFGIGSGGLVVPGYLALFLDKPLNIVITFAVAFAALYLIKILSIFTIVYGRRRTILMILAGYIIGMLLSRNSSLIPFDGNISIIGYIIPGLIAVWMDRQGIL
ncbi:MAG: poly-gamma-glutamate biosynthesis protein PgsC, partial [Candidatus Nanoarchaeia archaeon]